MSASNPVRRLLNRQSSWFIRYYLPRMIGSRFISRPPVVTPFLERNESEFIAVIRSVNSFAPTEMCRVMTSWGSDKGRGWHNYTTVYSTLFASLRALPLRIFELGLGTTSPAYAHSMGAFGRPGASLRGWRTLFPRAEVFGADIDRDVLFSEPGIQTYHCDQLDPVSIQELWDHPELRTGMDVIVEDGLHTFDANVHFLDHSIDRVKPGGYYIVEDIATRTIERWNQHIQNVYRKRHGDCEFALVQLPSAINKLDNNLLIVRRGPR